MKKKWFAEMEMILIAVFLVSFSGVAFAAKIHLKSGETVEGEILERTDKYIKIDFYDIALPYYFDNIEKIEYEPTEEHRFSTSAEDKDEMALIEELLKLSGTKRQIEQTPAVVNAQLESRKMEIKPEVYAKVAQMMKESFKTDALYQTVVDNFRNNFDRVYLSAVLDWLCSPLSKKMSELELEASSPEAVQGLINFVAQLQNNPPAPERLALVRRLDQATGATETTVEINIANFRGLAKAIDPTLPAESRLQAGQLEQLVNEMRTQLQASIKDNISTSFLYTYRSLSDEEIVQYIDFWESDAGRWFNRVHSKAIIEAISQAAEELGRQIVKGVLKQPAQE